MAEGGEETEKIGWPYTSVEYLNRAATKPEDRSDGRNSPWVGLSAMEGTSPPSLGMSSTASELGESYPEALPSINPALINRPSAPAPGSMPGTEYSERVFQPIVDTGMSVPRSRRDASPEIVTLYSQPDDRPMATPVVARPPPGYAEAIGAPQIVQSSGLRHAEVMTPPTPTLHRSPACVGDPFHHARHMFTRPPPSYGRSEGHITMGRGSRYRGSSPFQQEFQGAHEGTQTASGVKPMFLKSQSGPAGLPDARVQCPRCLDDRWYVDIVTEMNPCADDPVSVLDSRMKCLTCAGDVWYVDLFTTRDASRTRTPISPPQIHRIERIVTPSRESPVFGPEPPRVTVRPFPGGRSERRTPDSGYGSRSATPRQNSGDGANTPTSRTTHMSAAEWIRRSRAIRRLMFEQGIADAWGGSEMS